MRKAILLFCLCTGLVSIRVEASITTLNLELPFSSGGTWYISRGYNDPTPNSTHGPLTINRYALDFNLVTGFDTDLGVPVLAAASGLVLKAECDISDGYGCRVVLSHASDTYRSRYAHLTTITVKKGDFVSQGKQVGLLGNTGFSQQGSHLHFSLHQVSNGIMGSSVPPEPMNEYSNFTAQQQPGQGPHYTSDVVFTGNDLVPVGYMSADFHNGQNCNSNSVITGFQCSLAGKSSLVTIAHRRNAIEHSNIDVLPNQDPGNPNGEYLHQWQGAPFTLWIQNFHSSEYEKSGSILYRDGAASAYVVRAGFWELYGENAQGPTICGAPTSDEKATTDKDPDGTPLYEAYQTFEKCIMVWDPAENGSGALIRTTATISQNSDPELYSLVHGGIVRIASSEEYPTGNFTGADDKTLTLALDETNTTWNQVELNISNLPGLPYDDMKVFRNGTLIAQPSNFISTFTDTNVTPGVVYTYYVEAGYDNWAIVSRSNTLAVSVSHAPGTLELTGHAASSTIAYLDIIDEQYNTSRYRLFRDSVEIAKLSGKSFTDPDLSPNMSYSYVVEVLDGNENVIDVTNALNITTPEDPSPPPPDPEDPPEDPQVTMRLVDGVHLLTQPPYMTSTCDTIRYTLENVDPNNSISLRRVGARAYVDHGVNGSSTRYFQTIQAPATDPFVIPPGGQFAYEGDNCNDKWPGLYGFATIMPFVKLYSIAGDRDITDIGDNAETPIITIHSSYTLPDYEVYDVRSVPEFPKDGDDVTIEFEITNIGDDYGATWHLVTDFEGNIVDTFEAQVDPGYNITVSRNLGMLPAGNYVLHYELDPQGYLEEWNEENNNGTIPIYVPEPSYFLSLMCSFLFLLVLPKKIKLIPCKRTRVLFYKF